MAPWLAIGSFGMAFLLALGLNRLALIPWRRSVGKHWTERARLLHPVQKSARLNNWLIPANLALLSYSLFPKVSFLFVAIPGFLGALLAGYLLSRVVVPDVNFKSWLHLVAASLILFFFWWGILIFAIFFMPEDFGIWTWLIAGAILLLMLAFNFGLGIRLLKRFSLVQPATEHLKALVAEVSRQMGVPVRATWILSTHVSNAVAFPTTRQLIFTSKLLLTCTDYELKAVCAHELGHLNEPRKVVIMRVLVSLAYYPLIFARPLGSLGEHGPEANFMLLIGCLILWLIGMQVSRRMEKRADNIAVENQVDAAVYARALERLYQTNQMPAVMPRHSNKIHPDLYDRMLTAGVTPDYPKPSPAKGQCWTSQLMFCLFFILAVVFFLAK